MKAAATEGTRTKLPKSSEKARPVSTTPPAEIHAESSHAPISSLDLLSEIQRARQSAISCVFRPPRRCSTPSATKRLPRAGLPCRPKSVEAVKCLRLHGCPYQGNNAGQSFDFSGVLHQLKVRRPSCTLGVNMHTLAALQKVGLDRTQVQSRRRKLTGQRDQNERATWTDGRDTTAADGIRVGLPTPSALPVFDMSQKIWLMLLPRWSEKKHRPLVGSAAGRLTGIAVGCKHQTAGCEIRASCCGGVFSCRQCHDQRTGHKMDRAASVICRRCGCEGPVGAACNSAQCRGRRFAKYFCSLCEV